MMERLRDDWRSPWSAASPLTIDYGFAGAATAWRSAAHENVARRDLGLTAASGGLMSAWHRRGITARGAASDAAPGGDPDFRFLYVLKGTLAIADTLGGRGRLGTGGVALLGPGLRHVEADASSDLELIEITAAAKDGAGSPRPHDPTNTGAHHALYLDETPEAFVVGAGPRRYFAYRDLGTADFTERRIHIHVVKALEPMPGGTGWHTHTMSQLFVVLEGWAKIAVEGRGERVMHTGDAMCLSAGMRHDVPAYSADYKVLEMCIPADYQTTAAEAPAAVTPATHPPNWTR